MRLRHYNCLTGKNIFQLTGVFFLIDILLSYNLWFKVCRETPYISIIGFHNLNYFSVALSLLFCISIILGLIKYKFSYVLTSFIALLFLVLLDRMKWQPWVYIYTIALTLCVFEKFSRKKEVLFLLKFVLATVYFWAGIHKLSPSYIGGIQNFSYIFPYSMFLFKLIPYIEVAMGILLFFSPITKVLKNVYIVFHCFIIAFILVVGKVYDVIIPWNIYIIALIEILYRKNKSNLDDNYLKRTKVKIVIAVFFVLPILNFYNKLDHYLAFSLYSGKIPHIYFVFQDNPIKETDSYLFKNAFLNASQVRQYIKPKKNYEIFSFYKLVKTELNVPPIIETDVINFLKEKLKMQYPQAKLVVH